MRSTTTQLRDFLAAGRDASTADLWTFSLASGTVLRYTSADRFIPWDGNTFALGPLLTRTKIRWSLGLDVDQVSLTITPRPADMIGSTPLGKALRRGDFDWAGVRLARAYGVNGDGTISGGVIDGYFTGRMGPVDSDGFDFATTIYSPLRDLDAPFPRNVVQAQCANQLFDGVCALNAASWRSTGAVVGSIAANGSSFTTGLSQAAGYFDLGRFRWLTGANAGRTQSVRNHWMPNGVLKFSQGWPETVAVSDTFEVFAGCSKTQATCSTKFNNVARFRGFPYVPAPETTT
jgi:uncharacterized phage protein (TIGR02218 family)